MDLVNKALTHSVPVFPLAPKTMTVLRVEGGAPSFSAKDDDGFCKRLARVVNVDILRI